jgi:magnesium chelatase family protein
MNESDIKQKASYSSRQFHNLVINAFIKQKQRGQKELNGKLSDEDILKYCVLDEECKTILDKATMSFNLSFRSVNKILKVSRTIADLQESQNIQKNHLMEALSYRRR